MKKIYFFIAILFIANAARGQVPTNGDYRTSTGANINLNWSDVNTWQVRSGGSWATASIPPGSTSNVYIQGECKVTIDAATADCKNLNINYVDLLGAKGGRAIIGTNTLRVSGKVRGYDNGVVVVGSTDSVFYSSQAPRSVINANCITSSGVGKLSFIGSSRKITAAGEWGAYTDNLTCEINLNPADTAYVEAYMKAATWKITSGIFDCTVAFIYVDNGAGGGSVAIENGSTMISGTRPVFLGAFPLMGQPGCSLNVKPGGILKLTNTSPNISHIETVVFDGTVQYSRSIGESDDGSQTLLVDADGGNQTEVYTNLVLSGTGTKTLATTPNLKTTVKGKLSMQGIAVMSSGASVLEYGPSATLEYKGSQAQVVNPVPAEWPVIKGPDNVIIDNSLGVTFNATGGRTINEKLTLTSGRLTIGNNTLRLANGSPEGAGDAIAAYSASSYVVTNGTGYLTRAVSAAGGRYIFPVGAAANIEECSILFEAAPAGVDLSTRFIPGFAGTNGLPIKNADGGNDSIEMVSKGGIWEITASADPGAAYTGTFIAKNMSDITNYNRLHLVKRANAGANWILDGTHVATTGSNILATLQRTGMLGFSQFGVGGPVTALPVSIINFSGKKEGNFNVLRWTTGIENNNSGFEVQRSTDGIHYVVSGFVNTLAVEGNSTVLLNYMFTDNNPAEKNYYRLRMIGNDGQSRFSAILLLKGENTTMLKIDRIFPNPASNELNIMISAPHADNLNLLICDSGVKVVIQKSVNLENGSNTIQVDVGRLQSGNYVVRLTGKGSGETVVNKLVKQ